MEQKFVSLILGSFLLVPTTVAQNLSGAEAQRFIQASVKSPQNVEILADSFGIADMNNDGFVSENEFAIMLKGVDFEPNLTKEEKNAKKARLQKYFVQADKNANHKLDKKEYIVLMQKEIEFEANAHLSKIQKFVEKSPEEMVAETNAAMDKLKSAITKLQEVPAEKLADKFIADISNAMADENYFQMDKNKDGCVTEDEYANYMIVFDKNINDSVKTDHLALTKDDWRELYQDEKKAAPNCLTKEEYIRNFNNTMETAPELE